jgi:hypothetical protein
MMSCITPDTAPITLDTLRKAYNKCQGMQGNVTNFKPTEYHRYCIIWISYYFNVQNTGGPPYPRVIRSKTYRSYVKSGIILNAVYNVIFM